MNELNQIFAYNDNLIRVSGTPEKLLFVAADVCRVLGISNARHAVANFSGSEKGVVKSDTLGGLQEMLGVTEAGLYRLIFRSNKAAARKFQDWVFSEVLPSIRKTGGYQVNQVESDQLWQAFGAAKTGRVQMTILTKLGVATDQLTEAFEIDDAP